MTIDIQSLTAGPQVHIGAEHRDVYAGDSLLWTCFIAEGSEDDGTPIAPALFATDNSGWVGAVALEGNPFAISMAALDDTGAITLIIAKDTSVAGRYRFRVTATNAVLSAKVHLLHGTIVISPEYPS